MRNAAPCFPANIQTIQLHDGQCIGKVDSRLAPANQLIALPEYVFRRAFDRRASTSRFRFYVYFLPLCQYFSEYSVSVHFLIYKSAPGSSIYVASSFWLSEVKI